MINVRTFGNVSEFWPKSLVYFIYSVINLVKFHILSEECEIFSSAVVHVIAETPRETSS